MNKKHNKNVILIVVSILLSIFVFAQFLPVQGTAVEQPLANQDIFNTSSSNNQENSTKQWSYDDWMQYEQELLNSIYNDSWTYKDWRQFVILIGNELGQLNETNIDEDWIQHNIHIATIIKWGLFNGTMTEEESQELANDQFITHTVSVYLHKKYGLPNDLWATDQEIIFDLSIGINGLDLVFAASIHFKSTTPGGRYPSETIVWERWFDSWLFDHNTFDGYYTSWDIDAIVSPHPGYIENSIEVYTIVWANLFLVPYSIITTPWRFSTVDDDILPPVVSAWLYPSSGFNQKVLLENDVTYDISDIDYDQSQYWAIRIQADDYSHAMARSVFDPDQQWIVMPLEGYFTFGLREIYDRFPDDAIIEFNYDFRDYDHDRGNDYSDIVNYKFTLSRVPSFNTPSFGDMVVVKIYGLDLKEGLYLSYSDGTQDYVSTCIYPYKENHQKNEVSVQITFENKEIYPIRIKLGGLVPYIKNVQYTLLEGQDLYSYNPMADSNSYNGDRINPNDLEGSLQTIFQHDLSVNYQEGNLGFHFWVEILPGEIKAIELCKVSADDIRLLDANKIVQEDLQNGIFTILGLGSDYIFDHIGGKSKPYVTDESRWAKFGDVSWEAINKIGFGTKHYDKIYQDWSSITGVSTRIAFGDSLGGLLAVQLGILEAYVASEHMNDNFDWWWHLNDGADEYHYARGDPNNVWENVENILKLDDNYWKQYPLEPLVYYCGIGFIPDEHQTKALEAFIKIEANFESTKYLMNLFDDPLTSGLTSIVGIGVDIYQDSVLLPIANGVDPPDLNYHEKPNEPNISFPYETYPELYNAIQEEDSLALKGKAVIDLLLTLEHQAANLLIATDRYNTAFNLEDYEASFSQAQYIQEFGSVMMVTTEQLNTQYIGLMKEIKVQANLDLSYISDEDMEELTSGTIDFGLDSRLIEFLEDFESVRGIDLKVKEKADILEIAYNSIVLEDQANLNELLSLSSDKFTTLTEFSVSLLVENAKTIAYVATEKLGIDPATDEETELTLQNLIDDLEGLSAMILDENYYNAVFLAREIKEESLVKYQQSFRYEFHSIYLTADGFELFALQRNQIYLELDDEEEKKVINGNSVGFSVNLQNIVGQGITGSLEYINPILEIPNLPAEISYDILFQGQELLRDIQGRYQIELSPNVIKSLKVNIHVQPDSAWELETISFQLQASQNSPEKNMYFNTDMSVTINDDDITPPTIHEIIYKSQVLDGDPMIDIAIDATDESGINPFIRYNGINYQSIFSEGLYHIEIPNPHLLDTYSGEITVFDADNDRLGDQLSSMDEISFEIIDDDDDPPIIYNIKEISYDWDEELIQLTFELIAQDESGISYAEINIGTYTLYGLGIHTVSLPPGFYKFEVFVIDDDNDREGDQLSSTEFYNLVFDLTPPTTELSYDIYYFDGETIFITAATKFFLSAIDDVSGLANIVYRINGCTWLTYVGSFSLEGLDGIYIIEFFSIDNFGNIEPINKLRAQLTSLEINSYITKGHSEIIENFDVIFRKCKQDGIEGFKLVATNPGEIFYNIEILNNWPIPISMLKIDIILPTDFVTKGANPFHVFLDGVEVTNLCVIDGRTILISNIASGSAVKIAVHGDYGLKGGFYEILDEFWLESYIFITEIQMYSASLIDTSSASVDFYAFEKKATATVGFVKDESGNPLAYATVELILEDGTSLITQTNSEGFYYFLELPTGEHQIRVSYLEIITDWQVILIRKDEIFWMEFIIS